MQSYSTPKENTCKRSGGPGHSRCFIVQETLGVLLLPQENLFELYNSKPKHDSG